jgi:hypothetical protein
MAFSRGAFLTQENQYLRATSLLKSINVKVKEIGGSRLLIDYFLNNLFQLLTRATPGDPKDVVSSQQIENRT